MPSWDKQQLLNNSSTFCMYPWISAHKLPSGLSGPCCVGVIAGADSGLHTVEQIANGESMKKLRLDMLKGTANPICAHCHKAEAYGNNSPRKDANRIYAEYIDVVDTTETSGYLPDFKYRYLDIRFSNLCNMKCRSCEAGYSSQWEIEDAKYPTADTQIQVKDFDQVAMLNSIIKQIPNIDRAYFAGGEPLITEEHYVIIKEMIRQGNTGAQITYNTNISKLDYRDEDLLELWKQFDNHVMVFASLDHFGERAEYIRSGTDWNKVEQNYRRLHELYTQGEIFLAITTTITSLNYASISEFLQYMYDQDLVPQDWQVNFAQSPEHQCAYLLPEHIKQQAAQDITDTVNRIRQQTGNPDELQQFLDLTHTVNRHDTWQTHADTFREKMKRLDTIRGEQLTQVLPELAELYNE